MAVWADLRGGSESSEWSDEKRIGWNSLGGGTNRSTGIKVLLTEE